MPIRAALSNTFGFGGTNEHKELKSSDVDIKRVIEIRLCKDVGDLLFLSSVTNFFKKYLTNIKIQYFKIMLLLFKTFSQNENL